MTQRRRCFRARLALWLLGAGVLALGAAPPLLRGAEAAGPNDPAAPKNDVWYPTETYSVVYEEAETEGGALLKVLEESGGEQDYVLMMFFASWCGHCRKFRPQYERVANYFNAGREEGAEAFAGGADVPRVVAMRCDCAQMAGGQVKPGFDGAVGGVCDTFDVAGYPRMLFGTKAQFRDTLGHLEDEPLMVIDLNNEAQDHIHGSPETLIAFVEESVAKAEGRDGEQAQRLGAFVERVDPRAEARRARREWKAAIADASVAAPYVRDVLHDVELATGQSLQFALQAQSFGHKDAREDFVNWQSWLWRYHPSERCARGARAILDEIEVLWPQTKAARPSVVRKNFRGVAQCGDDLDLSEESNPYWRCDEYSCGLWQTFHAMSVQDGGAKLKPYSGLDMMQALGGFIDKFFMCEVCRRHFLQVLQSGETRGALEGSQRDFALWLWRAHNGVNARLAREEHEKGQEDPDRLKVTFPEKSRCPQCYGADGQPDADATHAFLADHYANPERADPASFGGGSDAPLALILAAAIAAVAALLYFKTRTQKSAYKSS